MNIVDDDVLLRFSQDIWLYLGNGIQGFVKQASLYKIHYISYLQNVAIFGDANELFAKIDN